MIGWHYAAKKFIDSDGDIYYGIVECFPDISSSSLVHTENPVIITSESYDGLIVWLEQALYDIKKYSVVVDE